MPQPKDYEGTTLNISDLVRDVPAVQITVENFTVYLSEAKGIDDWSARANTLKFIIQDMIKVGKLRSVDKRYEIIRGFHLDKFHEDLLAYVADKATATRKSA